MNENRKKREGTNALKNAFSRCLEKIKSVCYSVSVAIHSAKRKIFKKSRPRTMSSRRRGELAFFIALVAYPLAQFAVFYIGVNINSVLLAFQHFDTGTAQFYFNGAGELFDNFASFLSDLRGNAAMITATLNSVILYVCTLCIALPPYPFEPIQMTLINFLCIGAPGFVLGLEPNNARVKGSFLTNVLKRALPASIAVILAAALDIFVARVFGFSQLTLSTMCLLTSCAASVSLIWRISQPLTPLRVVLFVFVVAGILVGVIGFPELLSIANLSMGQMVILAVIVVFTCSVFFKLATMMDLLKPRRRHAATGFGRGVRVHLGRGGGKVSSTGSTAERFAKRFAADMAQRREDRTAREAEARALEGVAQAQPKKKKGTGANRSRVTKSAQGIKVSMPSKKKK